MLPVMYDPSAAGVVGSLRVVVGRLTFGAAGAVSVALGVTAVGAGDGIYTVTLPAGCGNVVGAFLTPVGATAITAGEWKVTSLGDGSFVATHTQPVVGDGDPVCAAVDPAEGEEALLLVFVQGG